MKIDSDGVGNFVTSDSSNMGRATVLRRTATVLRDAVIEEPEKREKLGRWVNFVHDGT